MHYIPLYLSTVPMEAIIGIESASLVPWLRSMFHTKSSLCPYLLSTVTVSKNSVLSFSHTAAEMFIEQPANITVPEGTMSNFTCTIIDNTAFRIFWFVDDMDVSLSRIQQRGINIISYNLTSSQLAVNASHTNNNSHICCTAFQFYPFREMTSQKAFLVVEGKQTHMILYDQVYMHEVYTTMQQHLGNNQDFLHLQVLECQSVTPQPWLGMAPAQVCYHRSVLCYNLVAHMH